MPVTTDIAATYCGPGRVIQRLLSLGPREDRALAFLMSFCVIVFVAQLPRLAREAHLADQDLNMLMGATLMAWVFIAPLLLYLIAGLSHLIARLLGGQGGILRGQAGPFLVTSGLDAAVVAARIGGRLRRAGTGAAGGWLSVAGGVCVVLDIQSETSREVPEMNAVNWRDLALTSITDPATAARMLLALNLPREALWAGLMLVAVLNTLLFGISNVLMPGPSPLPSMLDSPSVYFAFVAGGLILVIYAIFWTGRALGGQGTLQGVMILIVWLQGLRVLVQVAAMVLLLVMPLMSGILAFAAAIIGVYIMLHFVNQAHQFDSLGRSAGTLIGAFLGLVVALSVVLSLLGGTVTGGSYV